MSLVPAIPNPYLEAFAAKSLYGLVFCALTCLPYVASYNLSLGVDALIDITIAIHL
jgi:hypothetical protein